MAMPTKGTQLYFYDPDTDTWVEVGCPTAISGLSASREQIETTCLYDEGRTYIPGPATPGTATITIQADPNDASHIRLHQIFQQGIISNLDWALGWGDGKDIPPTGLDTAGVPIVPTTRTWTLFEGYIADFPFDFGIASTVTSAVSIQVSGIPTWIPKAP